MKTFVTSTARQILRARCQNDTIFFRGVSLSIPQAIQCCLYHDRSPPKKSSSFILDSFLSENKNNSSRGSMARAIDNQNATRDPTGDEDSILSLDKIIKSGKNNMASKQNRENQRYDSRDKGYNQSRKTNYRGQYNQPQDVDPNKNIVRLRGKRSGVPIFEFRTGSFQAIDCIKYLIKRVYQAFNKEGKVNYLDSSTHEISTTNLERLLLKLDLDLETQGLVIASSTVAEYSSWSGSMTEMKIPLIKLTDKRTAMEKYNEELSEIRLQELAGKTQKFANIAGKAKKQSNNNNKIIKIGWSISDSDLNSTKRNEIISLMKKSKVVMIYVDSKDELRKNDVIAKATANFEETLNKGNHRRLDALEDLELLKREKTVTLIKEIIEASEFNCSVSVSGSTQDRIIFKVTVNKQPGEKGLNKAKLSDGEVVTTVHGNELPKDEITLENVLDIDLDSVSDKKLLKEIKKKQRQAKQKNREEKKQLKKEHSANDVDIDSL